MAILPPTQAPSDEPILISLNAQWAMVLTGACMDYLLDPDNWDEFTEDVYYGVNEVALRLMGFDPIPPNTLTGDNCTILTGDDGTILTGD